jgi:hypothetical protein
MREDPLFVPFWETAGRANLRITAHRHETVVPNGDAGTLWSLGDWASSVKQTSLNFENRFDSIPVE